jgi:hypothetical protein
MKPMQLCRLLFYMQEATVEHKQTNKQTTTTTTTTTEGRGT